MKFEGNKSIVINRMIAETGTSMETVSDALGLTIGSFKSKMYANRFTFDEVIYIANFLGYSVNFKNLESGSSFSVSRTSDDIYHASQGYANAYGNDYPKNFTKYLFGETSDTIEDSYVLYAINNDYSKLAQGYIISIFKDGKTCTGIAKERGIAVASVTGSIKQPSDRVKALILARQAFGFNLHEKILTNLTTAGIKTVDDLCDLTENKLRDLGVSDIDVANIKDALKDAGKSLKSPKDFITYFTEVAFMPSEVAFIDKEKVKTLYYAILTENEKKDIQEAYDNGFKDIGACIEPMTRIRVAYLKLYDLNEVPIIAEADPNAHNTLLDKSVYEALSLSNRARNALYRNGIDTIDELVSYKAKDLQKLQRVGAGIVGEIQAALNRVGMTLG